MIGDIDRLVQRDRLADDLWELVRVPSPTRQERNAAFVFAEMLKHAGADVEVDETIPDSPSVIGRLTGARPGRVLQLSGHIDHIDVDHPSPERTDEIISGRGSADMKNGLAGILEIVRILKAADCDFAGQLLITAYGLHEAPLGDSRGLMNLIEQDVLGDAAIVFEGSEDSAVIMGKGQSIWNIDVTRAGDVCHELRRAPEADFLLEAVTSVIGRLRDKDAAFSSEAHNFPLLDPQSVFIGQVHYGDFYNRAPGRAFLQGTWRWHPDRNFTDVQDELKSLLADVPRADTISFEDSWIFVGEAFSLEPGEEIVEALKAAYSSITGEVMKTAGGSSILDVNRLVPFGKIPAVSIGLDGSRGHADYEFVRLDRMELGCRIAAKTVTEYLREEN